VPTEPAHISLSPASPSLQLAPESSAPPSHHPSPTPRPSRSRLPALTGLRAFAAANIVLFHFSDPSKFGPLAPIIRNGYTSVSFFLLLSGFILAYNYSDRAQAGQLSRWKFWLARFSRLYPIYLVALVLSIGMLMEELHVRTHSEFVTGTILTPLLLQGWSPNLATFWNTPAWTMSTEAFFYIVFPFVVAFRRPQRWLPTLGLLLALWCAGLTLPLLYLHFHPDGLHPGRYTDGFWIRALKFSPPPHLPSFLFGIVLADVDSRLPRPGRLRLLLGFIGIAATLAVLHLDDRAPYVLMHDGLLMPLFACAILGLAGENLISRFFAFPLFLFIGQASYCLYILHFNLWELIHNSGILTRTGLIRYDPWLSYALLGLGAALALVLVERPAQKRIRSLAR
jgi:peptidoglycan/LPS O-acetylase OafA/YrhL